jgi:hypothetical protein
MFSWTKQAPVVKLKYLLGNNGRVGKLSAIKRDFSCAEGGVALLSYRIYSPSRSLDGQITDLHGRDVDLLRGPAARA